MGRARIARKNPASLPIAGLITTPQVENMVGRKLSCDGLRKLVSSDVIVNSCDDATQVLNRAAHV